MHLGGGGRNVSADARVLCVDSGLDSSFWRDAMAAELGAGGESYTPLPHFVYGTHKSGMQWRYRPFVYGSRESGVLWRDGGQFRYLLVW